MILDILFQAIVSPSQAFGEISKRKPWREATLTATFVALVSAFTILPNPSDLIEILFGLEKGHLSILPAIFIWIFTFFLALLLQAGIFHLTARFLHGHGTLVGIICGINFSVFPLVFFAPVALLRAQMVSSSGNNLYSALSVIILLWVSLLTITAIRKNYGFSFSKSTAVFLFPWVVLIAVPLIVLMACTAY